MLAAAKRVGKEVIVEKVCLNAAYQCLRETGNTDLADAYVERYLRENQSRYHAFVIPQAPLTRMMPRLRDMTTPVFDSMEPFLDRLVHHYEDGFESEWVLHK